MFGYYAAISADLRVKRDFFCAGLAGAGFKVVLGARREDRLMTVARALGGRGLALDVRDPVSIAAFVDAIAAECGGTHAAGMALQDRNAGSR